jgi:hypothetical protein
MGMLGRKVRHKLISLLRPEGFTVAAGAICKVRKPDWDHWCGWQTTKVNHFAKVELIDGDYYRFAADGFELEVCQPGGMSDESYRYRRT